MKLRLYRYVADKLRSIEWRVGLWLDAIEERIRFIQDGPLPPSYSLEELDAQVQADMAKMGRFPRD